MTNSNMPFCLPRLPVFTSLLELYPTSNPNLVGAIKFAAILSYIFNNALIANFYKGLIFVAKEHGEAYDALAKGLVFDFKSAEKGLLNANWTPHNVKTLIIDKRGCVARGYRMNVTRNDGHSVAVPVLKNNQAIKFTFDTDNPNAYLNMLDALHSLPGKLSANISNIRDIVIYIGGQRGLPFDTVETARGMLNCAGLKNHSSKFTTPNIIMIGGDIPDEQFSKAIKAGTDICVQRITSVLGDVSNLKVYKDSKGKFQVTKKNTANSFKTEDFPIDAALKNISNLVTIYDALLMTRKSGQSIDVKMAIRGDSALDNFTYNEGDYPVDADLYESIKSAYLQPKVLWDYYNLHKNDGDAARSAAEKDKKERAEFEKLDAKLWAQCKKEMRTELCLVQAAACFGMLLCKKPGHEYVITRNVYLSKALTPAFFHNAYCHIIPADAETLYLLGWFNSHAACILRNPKYDEPYGVYLQSYLECTTALMNYSKAPVKQPSAVNYLMAMSEKGDLDKWLDEDSGGINIAGSVLGYMLTIIQAVEYLDVIRPSFRLTGKMTNLDFKVHTGEVSKALEITANENSQIKHSMHVYTVRTGFTGQIVRMFLMNELNQGTTLKAWDEDVLAKFKADGASMISGIMYEFGKLRDELDTEYDNRVFVRYEDEGDAKHTRCADAFFSPLLWSRQYTYISRVLTV